MLINNIIRFYSAIRTIFTFLIVPITTFLSGVFIAITFGLGKFLLMAFVNILLVSPLVLFSFIYQKLPALRSLTGSIGLIWAIVADTIVPLVSFGDPYIRKEYIRIIWAFPYSSLYVSYKKGEQISFEEYNILISIMDDQSFKD